MVDIAMCTNDQCPLKDVCYRQIAKPSALRQSYALFNYKVDCDGHIKCDDFIDSEKCTK